jgi:hypothetical protein
MRGGDEFRGWTIEQYQMTNLLDAVNYNTYATIAAASGKRKPKPPEPAQRPQARMKKAKSANNPFAQRLAAARRAKAIKPQGA